MLGAGGQGRVVAVDNYLIDDRWPAVLKTYNNPADLDVSGLEKIIIFPDQLHRNNRDWLMSVTSWPWAIVMDNGNACGFLMRAVPDIYTFNFMTVTQGGLARLSTVEFLLNSDDYVRRAGISISEKDRLNLLATLGDTLSRLHTLGIVIGDLSPKNLLFNLRSYSSCFFIDCDAISLAGESALQQVDTPEWELPAEEEKGTEAGDSYKFGLLAIRLFARDQGSRDVSAVAALSPELGQLARLSQDRNPFNRPGPGSWVSAIQSVAASASSVSVAQAPPVPLPRQQAPPQQAPWQPEDATRGTFQPPVGPTPVPRSRAKPLAWVGASAAALTVAGVIIAANVGHHTADVGTPGAGAVPIGSAGNPAAAASAAASAVVGSPSAPPAQPSSVGSVGISADISEDSSATAVAGMFDTYFTGINDHNYQQATSVFAPGGVVNPNDSSQVQHFASGVSTTSDSNITLVNITPSDGSTVQTAEVQFTSNQQAGYGPKDNPDSTCTDWDITYTLTQGSDGNYLINNVSSDSDSAC
jgi:hypothetical protein